MSLKYRISTYVRTIMFRTTRIIRTLCLIAFGGLLPITEVVAQDALPSVRFITLDDAQAQAAAATMQSLGRLGIDAAKYQDLSYLRSLTRMRSISLTGCGFCDLLRRATQVITC